MKVLNFIGNNKVNDEIGNRLKDFSLNENGVLPIIDIENIKKEGISEKLKLSLENNDKVVSIASEHSITIDLFKEFSQKFNNPCVVIFDAHYDSLDKDDVVPMLATMLKKEGIFIIGGRSWKKEEYTFIKNNRIRCFEMNKIMEFQKENVIEAIMEASRKFDALYVSIDLDVLDPAFAAVNCPEPAGLTSRELLFFIQKLKILKNLRAIDITEYNPDKDIDNTTAKLIAKLVVEMA